MANSMAKGKKTYTNTGNVGHALPYELAFPVVLCALHLENGRPGNKDISGGEYVVDVLTDVKIGHGIVICI